jgi:membrane protein YqaA with SNARE-associated domain
MDTLIQLLESYGYWGMAIGAFLAGSVFPFSSETVMAALQLAGLQPWPLFLSATLGNVAGSMFNYWIGTFGRMEWIEKYLHISRAKVDKTRRWIDGRGAWIGTLCFLPILGSVLSVTLGYMRANPYLTLMSITIGKALRYAILIISIYYFNN